MWQGVCHVSVLTSAEPGWVYLNGPDQGVKQNGTISWFNEKLFTTASCSIMVKDPARY